MMYFPFLSLCTYAKNTLHFRSFLKETVFGIHHIVLFRSVEIPSEAMDVLVPQQAGKVELDLQLEISRLTGADLFPLGQLAARLSELDSSDEIVLLDIAATLENRETRREWVKRVVEVVAVPFAVLFMDDALEDGNIHFM